MPRNLDHFTRCAKPGEEFTVPYGPLILVFILMGGVGGIIAYALATQVAEGKTPCSPAGYAAIAAIVAALVSDLLVLKDWYYNNRLMCIRDNQCAVGSVVGHPFAACDGDRKIDTLIAPFRPSEVDGPMMSQAVRTVASADASFPTVPTDLESNHARRLEYVHELLSVEQRRRVFLELVHNIMLNPAVNPGRDFQSRFYRREPPPVMDQDAFDHSPPDKPTDANPNALFKYDGQSEGGEGTAEALCRVIVGFEEEGEPTKRLIPFMHCEVEGDRVGATINAVIAALLSWLVLFLIACAICEALGGHPGVCSIVAGALSLLLALLLFFLFRELMQDGTEAGDVDVDVPDPTATDPDSAAAAGDVVFVFGKWIKDVEHTEMYEIHPVKAWYLVCRDPNNVPTLSEPGAGGTPFDVTLLTTDAQVAELVRRQDIMCSMITKAETKDPDQILRLSSSSALSMAGGIANAF
jgi:hypothetical protein